MKRLFFLLSILLPGLLLADNISEEQARRVATAFWQSGPQTRGSSSVSWRLVLSDEVSDTRSSGVAPAYYVYDNVSGPGFVIVAGDDGAMPVLGYSFENEFPQDDRLPANLRDWLHGMRESIQTARRDGLQPDVAVTQAWQDLRAGDVVVDLETARWNQEDPYNQLCPRVNGQASYTGCTATALAIAMRYHQWPERGTGVLPGYVTSTHKVSIPAQQLGHVYDWANMPLDYGRNTNPIQANAVATLMRDCALLLQSDFGPLGSSGTAASISQVPLLVTYMDYDKSVRCVYSHEYSTSEWHDLLQSELNQSRPVIYTGFNDTGGHAFVLDGYDTQDYYSVNWGWGGYCDGYFLLTALNPEGQGAGGFEGGYNEGQWAVIGLRKNMGGDYVEDIRFSAYQQEGGRLYNGFAVDGEVVQDKPFTLHFGFLGNKSSGTFTGEIMIAMADKDGQIVENLLSIQPEGGLQAGYGYVWDIELTITQPIQKGHRIRAYYRSTKTPDWTLVRGNEEEGCVWDLVLMDEQTIEESTTFTYDKTTRQIHLALKSGVSVALTDAEGQDYGQACQTEGQETIIDVSRLPAGTYTLVLQKGSERKELQFTMGETR